MRASDGEGPSVATTIHAGSRPLTRPGRDVYRLLFGSGLFVLFAGVLLLAAGSTLAYDYHCYEGAARALTDGRPLYDNAFAIHVGTCPGTYTYPPPFVVAVVPWLQLGEAAPAAWCVAIAACFLLATFLLPVRLEVRALVMTLGALDWPLLYAVKLGQVGPILYLLFAIAWRSIDRGPRNEAAGIGAAAAFGGIVKVQPALLALWALATRRYRAFAAAVGIAAAVILATLPFTGVQSWFTYADLVRGLGGTFDTPHDFAPGAIAFTAGAGNTGASVIQAAAAILAAACLLAAWRYASPVVGFQATIVASQLLSAPLRDHYAVLLLLPTAFLLERGRRWAVAIPLLGWVPVLGGALTGDQGGAAWLVRAVVPLTFYACLAVLLAEAFLDRRTIASATKDDMAGVRGSGE